MTHGCGPSLLNPVGRERQPLRAVRFVDGPAAHRRLAVGMPIYASLASIPGRRHTLEEVVGRLLPQVDHLQVCLNGYDDVPGFLTRAVSEGRLTLLRSQDRGDRGAKAKFWPLAPHLEPSAPHVRLTCDDDIGYPADYAYSMAAALRRRAQPSVVGAHGAVLPAGFRSYRRDRTTLRFQERLARDRAVHVLGTGTMAFRGDLVSIPMEDPPTDCMTDPWVAVLCNRLGIPRFSVARRGGWLTDLAPGGDNLWDRNKDAALTKVLHDGGDWPNLD